MGDTRNSLAGLNRTKYKFYPGEFTIRTHSPVLRRKYKRFSWERVDRKTAKGWAVTIFGIELRYTRLRTIYGYKLWRKNEITKISM